MTPEPGDRPNCCEAANDVIEWRKTEDEDDVDGWGIDIGNEGFYWGQLQYCPFCGHGLDKPDCRTDGRAAIERFQDARPDTVVMCLSCGTPMIFDSVLQVVRIK